MRITKKEDLNKTVDAPAVILTQDLSNLNYNGGQLVSLHAKPWLF
jgi:hypothetical protein